MNGGLSGSVSVWGTGSKGGSASEVGSIFGMRWESSDRGARAEAKLNLFVFVWIPMGLDALSHHRCIIS